MEKFHTADELNFISSGKVKIENLNIPKSLEKQGNVLLFNKEILSLMSLIGIENLRINGVDNMTISSTDNEISGINLNGTAVSSKRTKRHTEPLGNSNINSINSTFIKKYEFSSINANIDINQDEVLSQSQNLRNKKRIEENYLEFTNKALKENFINIAHEYMIKGPGYLNYIELVINMGFSGFVESEIELFNILLTENYNYDISGFLLRFGLSQLLSSILLKSSKYYTKEKIKGSVLFPLGPKIDRYAYLRYKLKTDSNQLIKIGKSENNE